MLFYSIYKLQEETFQISIQLQSPGQLKGAQIKTDWKLAQIIKPSYIEIIKKVNSFSIGSMGVLKVQGGVPWL